ncbi:PepSY-like domain-containing protein [Mesonia mobilis]|uniref:Putative beta-lactamase-inhibitor-like PepSY-like domain-containing protein n=1 Tax=Mesonia mobilis TaxID=369791 RepID=A0ABQ3BMP6_9FLAO|nr:PepSY-like domain-containing protein [Mesonia mobilis]MBQ0738807.1 PepSY-like domain-containing protein [Aquimarina celericrescens]GGZ51099.1 hypothetical protein GCM10008088_11150 [Mesonia mobilis]
MRKWIILGVVTLLAIFVGQAQENFDKLPMNAQKIVKDYYAGHQVEKIDADPNSGDESYQVKFKNGTKIDFNENGNATEISGEEKIPSALIPEKMRLFLENRYGDDYVTDWKMDDDGHQIEMKSGAELVFDLDGNFLKNKNI